MKVDPREFRRSAIDSYSVGLTVGVLTKILNVGNPLGWGLTYGCKTALFIAGRKVDFVSKNVFLSFCWNSVGALAVGQWITRLVVPGFTLHPLAWVFQFVFLGARLSNILNSAVERFVY